MAAQARKNFYDVLVRRGLKYRSLHPSSRWDDVREHIEGLVLSGAVKDHPGFGIGYLSPHTLQWLTKKVIKLHGRGIERSSKEFEDELKKIKSASSVNSTGNSNRSSHGDKIMIPIKKAEDHYQELAVMPNILERFVANVRERGLIGEDRNAKIIFLALVSRLLDKPVSIAVKGTSSGGKSFTVASVLSFFPPSAYYARTSMSEKALVYSNEPLKHRYLVIYEAAGMESGFASYVIRSLLSENKLLYEFVEKGQARVIEKEGPTGLIVTTTRARLHPENETRLLSLSVTDTPQQTRNILQAMAAETTDDFNYSKWHSFHEYLASCDNRVLIPFARTLAGLIPPSSVRLRRDMQQVLSLIKAHAILHQKTRQRDDAGRVIARLEDYAVVHVIISDLVAQGVEATVSLEVREAVNAIHALASGHADGVSYKAVGDHLRLDKSTAKRRCDEAIERGYLRNNQTRRNQPAQLVAGDPMPEDMAILPTPEDVSIAFHAGMESGCTVARENGAGLDSDEEKGNENAQPL